MIRYISYYLIIQCRIALHKTRKTVKVIWLRKALKQLNAIDKRYRNTIEEKANSLASFPNVQLDIMKLTATDKQYRMRVGDYRVIFQIDDGEPVICTIQAVRRRTTTTY